MKKLGRVRVRTRTLCDARMRVRDTHLRKPKLEMAQPMVANAAMRPASDLTMSHACLASNSAEMGEKCELSLPRYLAGPEKLATR